VVIRHSWYWKRPVKCFKACLRSR